jgi:hypothetical protein
MRNLRLNVPSGIVAIAIVLLIAVSCKDGKIGNPEDGGNHSDMEQADSPTGEGMEMSAGSPALASPGNTQNANRAEVSQSTQLVDYYLQIKDALVADNKEAAAKAGGMLISAVANFDTTSYSSGEELSGILEDAKAHAEQISNSQIEEQRLHFEKLSNDMVDLVGITGTEKTLYQDYCPMANNNKGAQWLSAGREIKNPYFGSKMMNCGSIKRELN